MDCPRRNSLHRRDHFVAGLPALRFGLERRELLDVPLEVRRRLVPRHIAVAASVERLEERQLELTFGPPLVSA